MSQAGYTPIQLYFSTTAAAVPVNTNLASGELAINITDGKLYYKDNGGTVRLLASNATSAPVLSFQTSLSGLTPSTATTGVVTLAGTLGVASGGTGLTTLATGSLSYGAGTSAFSALAIGTAGQILTVNSGATAPQWSTLSGVAVTTFSAGTTGFTPSSATAGAVTLAGTLATTNGGTGLTSFTSGGVVYASSTSALATGSALVFNGTNLGIGTATPSNYSSAANNLVIAGAGQRGMTIATTDGSQTSIFFADADSGTGEYAGAINYFHSDNHMEFYTASAEKMRLDSAGNLGLGVTPSAWSAGKAIQLGTTDASGIWNPGDGINVISNLYYNSTYLFADTGYALYYQQNTSSGKHIWATSTASGSAGGASTLTQAMTLDASGNFLISATSARTAVKTYISGGSTGGNITPIFQIDGASGGSGGATRFVLQAYNNGDIYGPTYIFLKTGANPSGSNTAVSNNWNLGSISFQGTDGTGAVEAAGIGSFVDGTVSTGVVPGRLSFWTANSAGTMGERVRITSPGTFTLYNDYQEQTYTANSSTAITLNITTNGTDQVITLTGTATITMPTATAGKSFLLKLKTGAGGYTVTWSTVKWPSGTAPTLTSTASRMDIFSFFSDGTNWYGCTVGQNYTP